MKKLSTSTPATAFAIAFTVVVAACATGTTTTGETSDVSLNEAGADASSTHLPLAADAASSDDLDGATSDAASDASTMPDASTTTACGSGSVELGEYATWSGKVNVHRPAAGTWLVDDDCTSGADHNTVSYCQKYWPSTTRQAQLGAVSSDAKPFTSGTGTSPTCGGVALGPGQNQLACCAP